MDEDARRLGREIATQLMLKLLFDVMERADSELTRYVLRQTLEEMLLQIGADAKGQKLAAIARLKNEARAFIEETLG